MNKDQSKSSYQMEESSSSYSDDRVKPVWSFSSLSLKRSYYRKIKNVDVFEEVRDRLLKFKEDWKIWRQKD